MMIGAGSSFWGNALFILPQNGLTIESEQIPETVKLLPFGLTLSGAQNAGVVGFASLPGGPVLGICRAVGIHIRCAARWMAQFRGRWHNLV